MELLIARRLTRRLGGTPLFEGVDLRLNAGERLGLAGPNGSGKSTLLRTLAGLEPPDDGSLWRAPGTRIGYLPQSDARSGAERGRGVWQVARGALAHLDELERRTREEERRIAAGEERSGPYAAVRAEFERLGGFAAEASLRATLAAFGFGADDDERPLEELSAGERRRLALVVALASAPDVLLLDEPTNHLDLATRERLAHTLAVWRGALVVVSHDRALLETSTNRTAFLEPSRPSAGGARLVLEKGAYGVARARRDGVLRAGHKREVERLREARRLEAMAAELATFGRKAQARKRAAERRRSLLLAATEEVSSTGPRRPRLTRHPVGAAQRRRPRDELLLDARHLTAEGVFDDLAVRLGRGQRIALLGPNGSGKSTLLALLAGVRPSDDPRAELRYRPALKLRLIDQSGRGLQEGRSVAEQAEELVGRVAAGGLLAGAGLAPRSWSSLPGELSGGERARAGLALTLAGDADLWLLDEPTNDLDLAAVEALETQLAGKLDAGGGALLLATHDRRLAERLTTEVWSIVDGRLERYAGVTEYLAGETLRAQADEAEPADEPDGAATAGTPTTSGRPEPSRPARPEGDDVELVDGLEEERATLLRLRDERSDLTERELNRLEARLGLVEEALMTAYAARLPPAAPRYRLRERGLTLFADDLSGLAPDVDGPAAGTEARLAVVVPLPEPPHGGDPAPPGAPAAPAATASAALVDLAHGLPPERALRGCASAWLEVRLVGDVGHLRLVDRDDACAAPTVRSALADSGARLAFTRLGATAVQLHHPAPLPGTLLAPAGDGWWSLGLGEFLALEGWKP